MSERLAKKIRRQVSKMDRVEVLPELKRFINTLPIIDRVHVAWRILWGRF